MRVKAVTSRLTAAQRAAIGGTLAGVQIGAHEGREHLVLGLYIGMNSPKLGTGVWIIYRDAGGNGVTAPIALYEVIDSTPSRHWVANRIDDSVIALWPREFAVPHFFEDTAERSVARDTLRAVNDLLDTEHRIHGRAPEA